MVKLDEYIPAPSGVGNVSLFLRLVIYMVRAFAQKRLDLGRVSGSKGDLRDERRGYEARAAEEANMAHVRQSRPDSGLGVSAKVFKSL